MFPGDDVVLRGRSMRPPRYYACLFEAADPEGFAKVKAERSFRGKDCTPERLRVREVCAADSVSRLIRSGDHEA